MENFSLRALAGSSFVYCVARLFVVCRGCGCGSSALACQSRCCLWLFSRFAPFRLALATLAPFTVYFWCLNCILLCCWYEAGSLAGRAKKIKKLLCLPHMFRPSSPPSPRIAHWRWCCRCRCRCRCWLLCCCCGCKFYLSFNIFYALYAPPVRRLVRKQPRPATHFKWLLKYFILHTKYLPCRHVHACVYVISLPTHLTV